MQDLAIKGLLTDEELGAKLADVENRRESARAGLEACRTRTEKVEQLRRDREAVLVYGLRPWANTRDLTFFPKDRAAL